MSLYSDLLARARQFDETALVDIYDTFSPGIYRYAMRLLGEAEQAEECVAETFDRFLRALQQGGGPKEHLQAYLYRIAHNWITDHYRRQAVRVVPLDPRQPAEADQDPPQVLMEEIDRQRVRQALSKLTPDQRQVIMLKYLEGWNNEEIATVLDKPVGAVKSLQHRALEGLKRLLLRQEEGWQ